MKTIKKTAILSVLALMSVLCLITGLLFNGNTNKIAEADAEPTTLGKTNFSVSRAAGYEGMYMLLATPIVGEIDSIYQVGYTFTGTQPELVQADTKKVYTTINGKSARYYFGTDYTDTTPMIVWEVENDADTVFNAQAYFIEGTKVYNETTGEWELIKDYDGPDEPATGAARNLKVHTITWKDGDGETLKTEKVDHGIVPEYVGATPTKTTDEEYVYAFDTWDDTIVAATADATYTATFTSSLNPVITDAITTINGIRTLIDSTDACRDEIDDARAAYDDLTTLQKTHVDNYAYLTDSEAIYAEKSTITSIGTLNSGFTGATPANRISLTDDISEYDTALSGLTSAQKERITGYDKYKGIKSSYTVVYDMVGSDLKDKILVDGAGLSGFYNGETHPSPSVFKPMCLHEPYGYCARVTTNGRINFRLKDAFKATLDLSKYTHVLIGVRNENTTCTYGWSNGVTPRTLATSTNTTDFITLRLTVEEFLNGYIYISVANSNIWFTPIVAVYDASAVITEIDAYLDSLGDNSITLENYKTYIDAVNSINAKLVNKDCNALITNLSEYNAKRFKVVDDMLGSDLTETRFTVTGNRSNGFYGPDSHPNHAAFAKVLHEGAYGKCARLQLKGGDEAILKVEYNLTPDLSDYNYVYVGIYAQTGTATWYWKGADGQTNVATAQMVEGEYKVLKVSVQDFLNGYLFTDGGAAGDAYWLTPIIATVE